MTPIQLKEILDQHQLWLDSDGEQGRRASLYRVNLTEANLNGVNLREANLDEVNLTGAQLGPEIRECWGFPQAQVSEDQLAWLCLHPRFSEWVDGLVIV